MKEFTRKVLLTASPVFGACLAIAVVQAAHFPFPLVLSWDAWPQWVVFVACGHTFTQLCMFITSRLFGQTPAAGPAVPEHKA